MTQTTQRCPWVFTLNNYTDDELSTLQTLSTAEDTPFRYIIWGKEVGENETPHLQGYLELKKKKRLSQLKALLGDRYHFEPRRGTAQQAADYCKKEDDYEEHGLSTGKGTRTDLLVVKRDIDEGMTLDEVAEKHFDAWVRYRQAFKEYFQMKQTKPAPQEHSLRPWQAELSLYLQNEPSEREVYFVVDRAGNAGKTWFARWWLHNHEHVQILEPEKRADMAMQMKTDTEVLFVNVPRSRTPMLQYDFLESVKDQIISSPKYESRTLFLQKKCHVVVLMNEMPDPKALSSDRYKVVTVNDPVTNPNVLASVAASQRLNPDPDELIKLTEERHKRRCGTNKKKRKLIPGTGLYMTT